MSYFFREKPRFGDKLRGNSDDEFLKKFQQPFDDKSDPINRNSRDSPFQDKFRTNNHDDDCLSKLRHHFDNDKGFASMPRNARDPFERHSAFSRGFPFDDEGFNRRSDIRSHLDDLAARHPEFAEHLLGPPWGDIPFHGTLRNRRRGSSSNSHQGHPDEDARSQASGSSAASAASGASGVSSHGEPDQSYQQDTSNKIPHYGLRNTVDIGQHRHNMENQEKGDRGQRSMSAPPENRQQQQPQEQSHQPSQGQNQRYISRVDITPQYTIHKVDEKNSNSAKQQQQSPPPQQQQKNQTQSNVRHIPIFVEGRDKPVISKGVDEPTYTRQQSPSRSFGHHFDAPPQEFRSNTHKPSQFNDFFNRRHREWPSQFQDPFQDTFDHPGVRKTHQQSRSPFRQPTEMQRGPQRDESPSQVPRQHQQQQQQPQAQQHQEEAKQKPEQKKPLDSLERVALVQQEVDSLTEQVKQWGGGTRKDKQYMYLDEMLTRELIKLDDIETEGKENVRQARKNAIKSIQNSISLLESKAPLPSAAQDSQQMISEEVKQNEAQQDTQTSNNNNNDNNDEQVLQENEQQISKEPIPLPHSPVKPTSAAEKDEEQQNPVEATPIEGQSSPANDAIPMEAPPVEAAMEVQQSSPEVNENETKQESNESNATELSEAPETPQRKSPKKLKKTKKQTPVSMEPIPLPAADKQS